MSDWSRRDLLLAVGVAGAAGTGWYVVERPHCRPRIDPLWTYGGEYWGRVVHSEDFTLVNEGYTATGDTTRSRLVCLEPYDGHARWANVETGGGYGIPTIHESRVYVGTGTDRVRALDAETGERLWTYDAGGDEEYGGGSWTAPAVAGGRVYAGISHSDDANADPANPSDYTHRVVALDADDGTEAWAADVRGQVWYGPELVGGTLVVGMRSGRLYGFDPETGERRWRAHLADIRGFAVVDDTVVTALASAVNGVSADGPILWSERTAVESPTAFRVRDGTAYVGGESGRVVAFDVDERSVRWTYDAGVAVGAIAVGEGGRFVVDQSGHLHRVSDAGRRENRVRLVETRSDDRCGWFPDYAYVSDATFREGQLYVSTYWWVRRFSVRDT